jgi:multidrug efflux pump subunit AcrA (membrane-fusion protein)
MTLVQLDPLLAVFSLTSEQSEQLKVGQKTPVKVGRKPETVVGIVEFIAPVTDAESGTILVKIRLDNPDGLHRSGSRCSLQYPDQDVANQSSSSGLADTTEP